ncbi:hypothetical protein, partial [Bacteroides acidifaciens]|uniref:hypothetical protein n=1 Tax=Bacteroides acidifaciens TaxID=85831 RepID=UPI00301579AE
QSPGLGKSGLCLYKKEDASFRHTLIFITNPESLNERENTTIFLLFRKKLYFCQSEKHATP